MKWTKATNADRILVAILDLGGSASTKKMCKELKIKKNSISTAVNDLRKDGYVESGGYGQWKLTEKGRAHIPESIEKIDRTDVNKPDSDSELDGEWHKESSVQGLKWHIENEQEVTERMTNFLLNDMTEDEKITAQADARLAEAIEMEKKSNPYRDPSLFACDVDESAGQDVGISESQYFAPVNWQREYVILANKLIDHI